MGSAVTFPVETLLFLAITLAACLTAQRQRVCLRTIRELAGRVAVFGDDIVVPNECRELVIRGLEYLYFKINIDKSFWNGKFRESCGVDAYNGHIITPAYYRAPCDGKPESIARATAFGNGLYSRFLVNTATYVESTIRGVRLPLVPFGSGVLGRKSFVKPVSPGPFKTRFNRKLQRIEYLVPSIKSIADRYATEGDSMLHQFFTDDPDGHDEWRAGVASKPVLRVQNRWVSLAELSQS
jgi:hypothetical protein